MFMKLDDGTAWCLPEGYRVEDRTLDDIRAVLDPKCVRLSCCFGALVLFWCSRAVLALACYFGALMLFWSCGATRESRWRALGADPASVSSSNRRFAAEEIRALDKDIKWSRWVPGRLCLLQHALSLRASGRRALLRPLVNARHRQPAVFDCCSSLPRCSSPSSSPPANGIPVPHPHPPGPWMAASICRDWWA